MDFRRLRVGEYLTAVAGLLLILSLFGPWYGVGGIDLTAWQAFAVLDFVFLILGILAVGLLFLTAAQGTGAVGIAADSLLFLVAAPVALIALFRLVNLPGSADELNAGRTFFCFLGTLAVLGVAGGALRSMRDERLSEPDSPTDSTGAPVQAHPEVETLPASSGATPS